MTRGQRECGEQTRDEHMQLRRRRWIKMDQLHMLLNLLQTWILVMYPHLNLNAPNPQQAAVMDSHHNLLDKLNRLRILQYPHQV